MCLAVQLKLFFLPSCEELKTNGSILSRFVQLAINTKINELNYLITPYYSGL